MKTIPTYPDYAITEDGQVWSKRKWKWLKISVGIAKIYNISQPQVKNIVNGLSWKHILEEQKMLDKMIDVDGRKYSVDTVKEALKSAGIFTEKKERYIFRAGDVVEYREYGMVSRRVIVNVSDELWGISVDSGRNTVKGQDNFEAYGYKKIGKLKNYL